jgi:hypothetical protein
MECRCILTKENKCGVVFWKEAKKDLKAMSFESSKRVDKKVPSLKNWTVTLNGLDVYKTLRGACNISLMKTRSFNQDPLENFFGQMRQQGHRNINPAARLFQ